MELGVPFKLSIYRRLFLSQKERITSNRRDYLEDEHIKNSPAKYLIDFYLDYIRAKTDKKKRKI